MARMVVFDVGETLVDETRQWGEWADWLGVPRLTFFGALGGLIAAGRSHRDVFALVRPDLDHALAVAERARQGWRYDIRQSDFYPDAVPCLRSLRERGFRLGVVGNQPEACEASLRQMGLSLDLLGSSERWGVSKPSTGFFRSIVQEAGLPPDAIYYVGDHPANDIKPAHEAGLKPVFVVRGPWGLLHADSAETDHAVLTIRTLAELPDRLAL
jgi:HAD superfamily hydrolase (TIGR01549 family)